MFAAFSSLGSRINATYPVTRDQPRKINAQHDVDRAAKSRPPHRNAWVKKQVRVDQIKQAVTDNAG